MSTFQQKTLFAALVASGVLGVVSGAQAMPIDTGNFSPTADQANNIWTSTWTIVNTTRSPLHVHETLRSWNAAEVIDITLPPGGHVTVSVVRVNGELVAPAKADEIIGDSAAATLAAAANDDETLSAVKNA